MFGFLEGRTYSNIPILRFFAALPDVLNRFWGSSEWGAIGVDMADDNLKLAQLVNNGKGISLIAAGIENRPSDIKAGSGNWQRWAIKSLRQLTANGNFKGKNVVAAIPSSEVFIDHIKMPKLSNRSPQEKRNTVDEAEKLQQAVFSKIKQKLPFEPDQAMIKYIPTEQDYALVIAAGREKIDRHLAIYENANLHIKSIAVWPVALANTYTKFFGRRKTDIEAIVMLLDIEPNRTNVVICRHKNPLFARSITIGVNHLQKDEMLAKLVSELNACRQQFNSMYKEVKIERLIFLSGKILNIETCAKIARKLKMPTQVGDCLTAAEIDSQNGFVIDRRQGQFSWATAFGLSLS